ncbi:MAG: redoxin domain-containing protein [Planctomycetaceae bacterium]|nr:redoxin domain-containing protein [Planctomycetaceae bacterium]
MRGQANWLWRSVAYGLLLTLLASGPMRADDTAQDAANGAGDDKTAETEPVPAENPFPGRLPAPSFEGGVEWYNCNGPISIKELRGKIVLLDFWTYCCINCMHVLPDLKYLEEKYPNELVVIGVHAAKFDNEKVGENIREAIMRYEISHPVVNDANMTIARKYGFRSWPTFVLIDPEGQFVGQQPGEGNRELFDMVISKMIAYHRAKGTLDETPVKFNLEREQVAPTPLRYPGKLLADVPGNRLFISDSNHNRIVISNLQGELLVTIGSGQIGHKDGGYAEAMFDHPQGMALVGDVLYVADTENHMLRTIDLKQQTVSTLAGTGKQSHSRYARNSDIFPNGGPLRETELNSPWDLWHQGGVLYIAMAGPHQLWKHDLGSKGLEVFAGTGREDILDAPLAEAALAQPSGIVSDGKSLFFVDSEGSAVRRADIADDGQVTTLVGPHDLPQGRSLFEFGDIDGVGTEARLQHPIGLAYHNGSLLVTDTYNHKVKWIDLKTNECTTWLGTGTRGTGLDPVELNEPAGLIVVGDEVLIADTNNHRLLRTNLQTKQTTELVIQGLTPPAHPKAMPQDETDGMLAQRLPQVTVSGETIQVTVEFDLPLDFKLNQLAPIGYRLRADDAQQQVNPAAIGPKKQAQTDGKTATFPIPLTGATGSTELEIQLTYQFCSDGKGGVCRFASERWTLPIVVAEGGTSRVTVKAKP